MEPMNEWYDRELTVNRSNDTSLRVIGKTLQGRAITYNSQTVGPVEVNKTYLPEIILPGAFDHSLKNRNITFTWQHDDEAEYGDTQSKSLRLIPHEDGIDFELDLPAYAHTIREKIASGLIKGMSFGFRPTVMEVKDGIRYIVKAELKHISPVYSPAYAETSVELRQMLTTEIQRKKLDLIEKTNAAHKYRK